jgi:hypothetical protein
LGEQLLDNCSEACNKNVPVVLIDLHSCSLDSKIRDSLGASPPIPYCPQHFRSALVLLLI